MPTPEPTILGDRAVSEIKALSTETSLDYAEVDRVMRMVPALCATVKHLREMMADPVFGFQELQARLDQMQKERDHWRTRATEAEKAAEKWYHERY